MAFTSFQGLKIKTGIVFLFVTCLACVTTFIVIFVDVTGGLNQDKANLMLQGNAVPSSPFPFMRYELTPENVEAPTPSGSSKHFFPSHPAGQTPNWSPPSHLTSLEEGGERGSTNSDDGFLQQSSSFKLPPAATTQAVQVSNEDQKENENRGINSQQDDKPDSSTIEGKSSDDVDDRDDEEEDDDDWDDWDDDEPENDESLDSLVSDLGQFVDHLLSSFPCQAGEATQPDALLKRAFSEGTVRNDYLCRGVQSQSLITACTCGDLQYFDDLTSLAGAWEEASSGLSSEVNPTEDFDHFREKDQQQHQKRVVPLLPDRVQMCCFNSSTARLKPSELTTLQWLLSKHRDSRL